MCFSPISCVCSIETTRSRNMRTWPIGGESTNRRRSDGHAAQREHAPRVGVGPERGPQARRARREARSESVAHEARHRAREGGRVSRRHEETAVPVLDDVREALDGACR